jgi:hypothetical protein
MAEGEEEQLLSARAEFMESVGDLASHLENRVTAIGDAMEAAAAANEARATVFQEVWRPKLDDLTEKLRAVRRRALTNPTLCVMGKRGQGKTSLLSKWLAGDADSSNPLSDIHKLPTGDSDTTAALIRLRSLRKDDSRYQQQFLYCTMLEDFHLAEIPTTKRPTAPPFKDIRVLKDAGPAYWVCRFPNPDRESRHRLVIDDSMVAKVTDGDYGTALADVQWHAREVLVPFDLSTAVTRSHGTRTLSVLDIIDAPGADAMVQGDYPDWKKKKNSLVFKAAIEELDVLLLIASSDTSAIQLGYQFQEDIWWEWLDRCRNDSDMKGRLVLAFTKAVHLFSDAERRVLNNASPNNEINNFATRICKNVLEGLASTREGVPQLLRAKDPSTWPPMFFFEKDSAAMTRFREGIAAGTGPALAADIISRLLASPPGTRVGLPLGGQCVFEMASDILNSGQIAAAGRQAVATDVVHALCCLLDPADMGYAALTDLIHEYATGGPVAIKFAEERKRAATELAELFRRLLGDLATPAGNQKSLQDLETVQGLLREYWSQNPEGPRLHRGTLCHARRDQIRANRNRAQIETTIHVINHDMVLEDVASDCVIQLKGKSSTWNDDQTLMVARVLHACLKSDSGLREMGVTYRQAIGTDYEALHKVQTVALERAVRVIHFLVYASKEQLGLVAKHCFDINQDEAELMAAIAAEVMTWNKDDEAKHAAVATAHASLQAVIARMPCKTPYAATTQPAT